MARIPRHFPGLSQILQQPPTNEPDQTTIEPEESLEKPTESTNEPGLLPTNPGPRKSLNKNNFYPLGEVCRWPRTRAWHGLPNGPATGLRHDP
jgi:hypothetical protein